MSSVNASMISTDETFTATRNGALHHLDFCFYKGIDISLEHQFKTGIETWSDHSALLFKIKNASHKKGKEK